MTPIICLTRARSGPRRPPGSPPLPAAPLLAALSRDALGLLGAILRDRPATVSALAALTGRSPANVSRSLQVLARYGLMRLARQGRDVRPGPVAGAVRVDFATGTWSAEPAPG